MHQKYDGLQEARAGDGGRRLGAEDYEGSDMCFLPRGLRKEIESVPIHVHRFRNSVRHCLNILPAFSFPYPATAVHVMLHISRSAIPMHCAGYSTFNPRYSIQTPALAMRSMYSGACTI
jgi:hypothetical protein